MRRRPKPAKTKVEAQPPVTRKSRKNEVGELEKRLAEALGQLQTRDRQLVEAQEQQAATSEILRVISRSTADVQPVLDVVAENAAKICDASDAIIFRGEGDQLRRVAHFLSVPLAETPELRQIDRANLAGRIVLERTSIQITDIFDETAAREFPETARHARYVGHRTLLGVPLMCGTVAIGVIVILRTEVRPFTPKQIRLLETFADQAVIAIENARLFNETKEALDREKATSDILRVISSSPTELQPVFDTIVASAVRLCNGNFCGLFTIENNLIRFRAHNISFAPEALAELQHVYPMALEAARGPVGDAIRTGSVLHTLDMQADASVSGYALTIARRLGAHTQVVVPLWRKGAAAGAILVARPEVRAFADPEIELLKTFADQAVIAVENVRLFKELQEKNRALTETHAQVTESLEQQTATSEILRVIASSPTDVQPVFDAIAEAAMRLCGAHSSLVTTFDGELLHLVAQADISPEGREVVRDVYPRRPNRGFASGRSVLTRAIVQIPDLTADPEFDVQVFAVVASVRDFRSILAVPMLRDGLPIGTINAHKAQPGPFTDKQVALLQTFADQAVIAIENVRLFKELGARNRDLTATSQILQVISSSPTDVQPVLETVVENAVKLCEAERAFIFRFDGELLRAVASYNASPELRAFLEQNPISPGRHSAAGRVAVERRTVHIPDVQVDPEYTWAIAQVEPLRTLLGVPMLKGDELLGVIITQKREVAPFTDKQIALVETFADQAVIAIENVRLFTELRERTAELTRSVDELTALGAVSQALSSTLDVDVVLDTIVARANDLIGADGCTIFEYDEAAEQFHLRATRNLEPGLVELARGTPLRRGDQGILGRLPSERQAVQVPDITLGFYSSPISAALIEAGYRAVVAVPLIREDHLIGALTMNRKTPGEFPRETIQLLQTFATQSALAIQNARLFREIEAKSRELAAASQHKSEFLANMSHELRTPLNAIIGFSEVLTDRMFGELNEKQEEYLKDIYASGRHLLSLINDILDLSKIEAGRMELELTDFDLPTAIDNALMLVRERAGRRSIMLHSAIDPQLSQVRADERKIRQVVLNLLSNAIKFTPEGGRIEVAATRKDGLVEISVSDTGVGIAPEDQDAVFEEFRQVGTAAKKVEGTGLGLTLCRKFVELHGGRIWVKSQVGVGSTFSFNLPLQSA